MISPTFSMSTLFLPVKRITRIAVMLTVLLVMLAVGQAPLLTARASPTVTTAPNTVTPGDIPDTVAYVTYTNVAGQYQFKHPEGWAQTSHGTSALFTDSYNGVSVAVTPRAAAPTRQYVDHVILPKLRSSQSAFSLVKVVPAKLSTGGGFLTIYRRNSPTNAVTNRSVRQQVNLYTIYYRGRIVSMSLFGAVGADNVDPYAKMSQSLRIK
jgi:hypothetical protein